MRPPYGALDHAARDGIRVAGFVPVLWTIDSRDWQSGTAGQIATRILAGLRPNATNIVLQHDGVRRSPTSVDAVPLVIRGARRRGYCFVALDERGRPGFPTPTVSVSASNAGRGTRRLPRSGSASRRAARLAFCCEPAHARHRGKDVDRVAQR